MERKQTAWQEAGEWYNKIVGEEGHYYHRQIILPNLLRLFALEKSKKPSLLDLGCGQGVLARALPSEMEYCGVDLALALLAEAKKHAQGNQRFLEGDICTPLSLYKQDFSHTACVLALQNTAHPEHVFTNAARHLSKGGCLFLVLNHPCFRIPRLSHWGIDGKQKIQYRRVDRYLSPLKIPIQIHPGTSIKQEQSGQQKESGHTWSFHHSLSDYSALLAKNGFVIALIEEWASDKLSTGAHAKRENRARAEIPLFLTLVAKRI